MAINEKLKNVVVGAIFDKLNEDADSLPIIEDKEEKLSFIKKNLKIHDDRDYRIVMRFADLIGYGYDFGKRELASYFYLNTLKVAKKMSGGPNLEEFVSEGITDNCGWYLTRI
jgi:hypothetical protein